jgi:predicted transposase YbfD/YdcC
MAKVQRFCLDEIIGYFDDMEDPRDTVNRKHPLVSVVIIAMMAILSGAGGPTAIARWAALKADFLTGVLPLPNGIPGKDVFRRVLGLLQPAAFQACFVSWLQALRARAAEATAVDQPVLAVDGKAARRSHDRGKGLGALHCVSVWASDFGLSLGQVACDEKSNEIRAIPELLRMVDIRGTIITIDALGTQKAIAEQIVASGADYVLALKGNQETLHQAVIDYVNGHLDNDFADVAARRHQETDRGHGREEYRGYIQMPVPEALRGADQWKGLRSIGLATLVCKRNGQGTGDPPASSVSILRQIFLPGLAGPY